MSQDNGTVEQYLIEIEAALKRRRELEKSISELEEIYDNLIAIKVKLDEANVS